MNELDSLLRAAGRMMLDYHSPKVFSKEHHADFVTEADIAVQSYRVDARQRASIICAKCCNQRIAKIPILWYNQGINLKRSD